METIPSTLSTATAFVQVACTLCLSTSYSRQASVWRPNRPPVFGLCTAGCCWSVCVCVGSCDQGTFQTRARSALFLHLLLAQCCHSAVPPVAACTFPCAGVMSSRPARSSLFCASERVRCPQTVGVPPLDALRPDQAVADCLCYPPLIGSRINICHHHRHLRAVVRRDYWWAGRGAGLSRAVCQ